MCVKIQFGIQPILQKFGVYHKKPYLHVFMYNA